MVYLRRFLDKTYPLRSSITANPNEIYKNYKLNNSTSDYFCAGVMVYDVKNYNCFLKFMKNIVAKLIKKFRGVEIPLNYELTQKNKNYIG